MQVAAFLSDLRSLSVCSHESAIGLVQSYKTPESDIDQTDKQEAHGLKDVSRPTDKDLQRADELVSLHQNVKLKHLQNGQDQDLLQGRHAVQAVLVSLKRHQGD